MNPWASLRFTLRMAWRDSRASRARLLLFTACILVGIAALVAVRSLGRSLQTTIDLQARVLLGADLSIGSRVRFGPDQEAFIASLGGEQAREIGFSTMISIPSRAATRLVQVRALDGSFPFYGQFETSPPEADARFRSEGGVLVEESVLLQFDARPGDEIRIGQLTTRIVGALQRVPGETAAFAAMAPRVYLRMADLPATGLLQTGSLARYRVLFRFPVGTDVQEILRREQPRIDRLRLAVASVDERKEDLGDAMRNLDHFLSLVGFIALLLGGVGIASAIQMHVRMKVPTIAVLRCLGCPVATAFSVYLVQALALGALGAAGGAVLGTALLFLLPSVVADFVPFPIEVAPSPLAIVEAATMGLLICTLFTLLPLTRVRRISPLEVLRSEFSPPQRRDPLLFAVAAALVIALVTFSCAHTQRWTIGLGFAAGLLVAFALLAGVAHLAIRAVRSLRLDALPFVIRQGLASVHRPQNRTLLLVTSLGLGTFLLLTLQLTQSMLLRDLVPGRDDGRPNAILFDVQPDQRDAVAGTLRELGLPVLDEAPIVTMRLRSLAGRPVEELLEASSAAALASSPSDSSPPSASRRGAQRPNGPPRWALRREFRSTFSNTLRDSESIVAGEWIGSVLPDTHPIPVSLDEGIAQELGVGLGDLLEWDIQGVPLTTRIQSLRKVEWRRVQPNFFVVFPRGPLDDAPSFHVLVTRVANPADSARMQREVVRRFPNVSVLDITLVLQTLDQVLSKVAFVIRFMALFTVATGLLVLVASVFGGRFQRRRESVLLRVLGASRRQVLRVLWIEYAVLGLLAAATGMILALAAGAALAWWVFEIPFSPAPGPWLAALLIVPALTVLTGFLASRGVTTHPPLEILREGA